jgi:hypothetical protein
MSKNAQRQRRAKAHHRDQMSRYPRGTPLEFFVLRTPFAPLDTPLMNMLRKKHG